MPSRRALLATFGGAAAIGVWQRRRILRRDDVATLESARNLEFDSEFHPRPPSVETDHVSRSYDRARGHVERTATYLDDDTPHHVESHLDRARRRLADTPPDEQADGAARESALETYRLAVASSATARGAVLDGEQRDPSDELQDAHDALVSSLDATVPDYAGSTLTNVIVQYGLVDDLLASAASAERSARGDLDTEPGPTTWERVEIGRFRTHDAAWLAASLDGPDRTDELEAAFDALVERTEDDVDGIEFSYDGDVSNHASDRWIGVQRGGDPEDAFAAERHAAAVRDQASRAMVTGTLDAFTELPSYRHLDETDADPPVDADDVLAAKRSAVDAFVDARDDVGDDPLGNHLLTDIVWAIEHEDRRLERLVDNVRSYDDDAWFEQLYRSMLGCRGAALEAAVVTGVVELIRAEDRDG